MTQLKVWYKIIVNFGVDASDDILEQKRIILLNELVVWAFLLQFLNYAIILSIQKYDAIFNILLSQIFTLLPLVWLCGCAVLETVLSDMVSLPVSV